MASIASTLRERDESWKNQRRRRPLLPFISIWRASSLSSTPRPSDTRSRVAKVGLAMPRSSSLIRWKDIPSRSASSSWVKPAFVLNSSIASPSALWAGDRGLVRGLRCRRDRRRQSERGCPATRHERFHRAHGRRCALLAVCRSVIEGGTCANGWHRRDRLMALRCARAPGRRHRGRRQRRAPESLEALPPRVLPIY